MSDRRPLTERFRIDGRTYATDAETLRVLETAYPRMIASGDGSAVICVMVLGLRAGRVRAISPPGSPVPWDEDVEETTEGEAAAHA